MTSGLKIALIAVFSIQLCVFGAGPHAGMTGEADMTAVSANEGMDCTEISVEFSDAPGMTPAERIAAMDAAFHASLSKFDYCSSVSSTAASSDSGGGAAADSGSGGGNGNRDGLNGELSGTEEGDDGLGDLAGSSSAASIDMSGTEPGEIEADAGGNGAVASVDPGEIGADAVGNGTQASGDPGEGDSSSPGIKPGDSALDNGTVPGDIPPAENDSVLEAQIRKAAMEEKDPALRERLWDEYRKYKGLPTKPSDS